MHSVIIFGTSRTYSATASVALLRPDREPLSLPSQNGAHQSLVAQNNLIIIDTISGINMLISCIL